ncbi:MAG: hypothetical protein IJX89_01950 [Alphaproteobacteria bacterium]|nr:hypothetical protein [Alphaproteobacteria bacterium]
MKIRNLLLASCVMCAVPRLVNAWSTTDISKVKSAYATILTNCKSNCSSSCIAITAVSNGYGTYNTILQGSSGGICRCVMAGYSADNCEEIKRITCTNDTQASTIIGTTNLWYTRTWNSSTSTCNTTSKFYCKSGYYGTATGANAGCSVCPGNATCPGDKEQSNVYCNKGYVAITTSSVGSGCRTCSVTGAYTDSALTTAAVATTAGLTLLTQATNAASCYLPAGTYYDSTGQFTITQDQVCYY